MLICASRQPIPVLLQLPLSYSIREREKDEESLTGKIFIILLHPTGETDWKILAIDVNDPLAENLNGG